MSGGVALVGKIIELLSQAFSLGETIAENRRERARQEAAKAARERAARKRAKEIRAREQALYLLEQEQRRVDRASPRWRELDRKIMQRRWELIRLREESND